MPELRPAAPVAPPAAAALPFRDGGRRGRPPLLSPEQVMEQIRSAAAAGTLFRVHRESPALYARARRVWGSWANALRAAGQDPGHVVREARRRAVESRRAKGARSPAR
jgi:hypothetical protein